MNPFDKTNENSQKTPDVRPISAIATETVMNVARPTRLRGAENLKNVVKTVVMPEYFAEAPNASVNGTVEAIAHDIMRKSMDESNA